MQFFLENWKILSTLDPMYATAINLGYRNDDIKHPSSSFENWTFQLREIGKNRVKTT